MSTPARPPGAQGDALATLVRQRLRALRLSARRASLRAQLSHNTLRVILAGARPTPETCDRLDPVLDLFPGTLRLLAGWPLPPACYQYSEQWARTLLEIAPPETRQQVVAYLLAQRSRPLPAAEPPA